MENKDNYKALLQASFRTRLVGQSITDTELTAEIQEKNHMAEGSIRAVKSLLKDALMPLKRISASARIFHLKYTHEWFGGSRLLVVKEQATYVEVMNNFIKEFNDEVDKLVINWGNILEEEKKRHGDRFNIADYPTADIVKEKCTIEYSLIPVPNPKQYLDQDNPMAEQLSKEYESKLTAAVEGIPRQAVESILEMVDVLNENLANDKKVVLNGEKKQGVLQKLQDFVNRAENLNLTGDTTLTKMIETVKDKLTFTADELKKDAEKLEELKKQAVDVKAQFEQLGVTRSFI